MAGSDIVERLRARRLPAVIEDDPFMRRMEPDGLSAEAADEITALRARVAELEAALEFYADPETYYGIGFLADSPCGEFAQDFSDDHGDDTLSGLRPGARARRALGEESA